MQGPDLPRTFSVVADREDGEYLDSGGWRDGGDMFAEALLNLWQVHRIED